MFVSNQGKTVTDSNCDNKRDSEADNAVDSVVETIGALIVMALFLLGCLAC